MAFVNARWGRVDDHKHFSGEIIAAAVENDTRNEDGFGFIGMGAFIEIERGKAMLAIDDEEFFFGFLEMANGAVALEKLETQLLGSE